MERRDVEMMQSPDKWPQWPFLPLIKRQGKTEGLLYAGDGSVIYLCNLYLVKEKFVGCEKTTYPSFEAVYHAGWRVD